MPADEAELFFFTSPEVEFASNVFVNVPTIFQYDDTPLVEVVQAKTATYSAQFRIFDQDGIYVAKAVGTQLFLTPEGKKSNLVLVDCNV